MFNKSNNINKSNNNIKINDDACQNKIRYKY